MRIPKRLYFRARFVRAFQRSALAACCVSYWLRMHANGCGKGHVQPRHVYVAFSLVIWYYILVYILVFYVIYDAPGRENLACWQGDFFLVTVTFLAWSRDSIPIRDSGFEPGIIADLRPILRALAG
jgi:hypothetical protein